MRRSTGLERFRFQHQALPELNLREVDPGVDFLGWHLRVPLLISSMTGGTAEARTINENLARAAQAGGAAMAVGSQRIAIHDPSCWDSFRVVREAAPEIALFGNIGAVQLNYGLGPADVRELVQGLGADGIFLHLNPLQEAIQEEGDTDFRGLLDKIGQVTRSVSFPVLVKEVGAGIDVALAVSLARQGVAAIDVSGAGGTSWARIEGLRAGDPRRQRLGTIFRDWGIPTAESLIACRARLPDYPLIASGGIRNGLEVAKALALGANLVGIAGPLLKAARESADAVVQLLESLSLELRVAMFASGAGDVQTLRRDDRLQPVLR